MGAAVVAEARCLPAAVRGSGVGGGLSVQLTGADSAEQPEIKHRCSATKQPSYSLLNLPGC